MSIRTKGAGYVVFDTYMNDSIAANDAVAKTGGAASISDRRWFGTVYGKYGISFDFTWANDNLQLRALGTKCMNKGFQYTDYGSRQMEGDSMTYGSNYDFTILMW